MRSAYWVVWLFLTSMALPLRAEPVTMDEMAQTRRLVQQGLHDEAANRWALEMLHVLLEREPANPLLLAWLGSSEAQEGHYAWMPWKKLDLVDKGLANLEKALHLSKTSPGRMEPGGVPMVQEVRLVAANTYVALPGMFNTQQRGKALVKELLSAQQLGSWPALFRAAVFLAAAQVARDGGEKEQAQHWLAQARSLVTDDYSRRKLQELEASL